MSTLTEIEAAATQLSTVEKRQLVRFLYESMPAEQGTLPPPRDFSIEEMNRWLDEDEKAGREFLAGQAIVAPSDAQ